MKLPELYIGVMSGTSMDGVDTALVRILGNEIELLEHDEYPMPETLKNDLLNICIGQQTDLKTVGEIDHQLGNLFSEAVLQLLDKSDISASDVTAIGNHGQTVFHQPTGDQPFTMQLGDANIIAAKTGIDTVADFRRKDMALGGQGAPLVPAFHSTIFRAENSTVIALNVGGISNISVLRPNDTVLGYDTGPGNMLMDAWGQKHTGHKFDKDAMFAKQGQLIEPLLELLLKEPYFSMPAPKSTGRELFNLPWLENKLSTFDDIATHDVQRTLCEFTAVTITNEVLRYQSGDAPELLVCGGGGRNPLLMTRLAELLPKWQVASTRSKGVDADYMEAMAFAWLAQRRVHGLPSNLPEVTGASKLASLGVIYPKN
ncbi:anhydro-N-acetylmuramic acid kinase [Vibrio sp. 10N.261.55.A7]|uniref:anhydro-N-acetylmuramic acid kinase n=1 Tax=Vibrio sp. 10N.261.55.A7 TaxID=1880851 RepID=UPI000C835793|nr:anhydro-N-acetylmuramic acid kinase [Vibrio sp. 10N.261.55.A7]PMJ89781.1 anhydro-N-acetylmuramic acid kinase [Vibrio sp. 10N.261.55.A7]